MKSHESDGEVLTYTAVGPEPKDLGQLMFISSTPEMREANPETKTHYRYIDRYHRQVHKFSGRPTQVALGVVALEGILKERAATKV